MDFSFWSVLERHEDRTVIFGHTNEGVVRVGDTFTKVQRKKADGSHVPSESIEVCVRGIVAYGRSLDALHRGTGGALTISPPLAIELAQGDMLSG